MNNTRTAAVTPETAKSVSALIAAGIPDKNQQEAALKAWARSLEESATKDRMLKSKEAQALVGVSGRTLWLWSKAGHIHPVRSTRSHVRYSQRELEAFLGYKLEA